MTQVAASRRQQQRGRAVPLGRPERYHYPSPPPPFSPSSQRILPFSPSTMPCACVCRPPSRVRLLKEGPQRTASSAAERGGDGRQLQLSYWTVDWCSRFSISPPHYPPPPTTTFLAPSQPYPCVNQLLLVEHGIVRDVICLYSTPWLPW